MAEYDKIAQKYVDAEDSRPERKYFINSSFFKVLKNLAMELQF